MYYSPSFFAHGRRLAVRPLATPFDNLFVEVSVSFLSSVVNSMLPLSPLLGTPSRYLSFSFREQHFWNRRFRRRQFGTEFFVASSAAFDA